MDKQRGIQKLEEALQIVEKVIKEKQGTFKLVQKPQIIGESDEIGLDEIIGNADNESGDEGSEDNEEGMAVDIGDEEEEEGQNMGGKVASGGKKKKKVQNEDSDEEEEEDEEEETKGKEQIKKQGKKNI